MSDVFLGYARDDRDVAQKLARALDAKGAKVVWENAGLKELNEAHVALVLWTKRSVQDQNLIALATRAEQRLSLFQVSTGNTAAPEPFKIRRAAALAERPSDSELQRLAAEVSELVANNKKATATLSIAANGPTMYYKQLEHLSPERHGALGLKTLANPNAFLSSTHLVPLTVAEFPFAMTAYPIIFDARTKTPMAVMGLWPGTNLFFADEAFDLEAFVPAFARRYPLLPVNANDEQGQPAQAIAIDRAAAMVSDTPDAPFFAEGQPTPLLQRMVDFCKDYERAALETETFVRLATEHDLFEYTPLSLSNFLEDGKTPNPAPQKVGEYYRITERSLARLPPDLYANWLKSGLIKCVYAHLYSLSWWRKIFQRATAFEQERGRRA